MCDHKTAQENIRTALKDGPLPIPQLLDNLERIFGMDRDFAASALLDAPDDIVVTFVGNEVWLQSHDDARA